MLCVQQSSLFALSSDSAEGVNQDRWRRWRKKLAQKIISEEKDLARRATLIDKDIASIVQDIGLQTTRKVIENTRDRIVKKKLRRADDS
jgi:hypothetical protein